MHFHLYTDEGAAPRYHWADFDFSADIPVEKFIDIMTTKIANKSIKPYEPKKLTGKIIVDISG